MTMYQVDIQFSCSHITTVPCESIMDMPRKGMEVRCARCKKIVTIINVGRLYKTKIPDKQKDEKDK